jgi:steroid Delta-isomerase
MDTSLKTTLTSERSRKELALKHCRLMNAGDVDALLELYAEDVRFEDPAGWARPTGRNALRAHLDAVVSAHVHVLPGDPVAGQDGTHVLVPITAVMDYLPVGPVYAERGWSTPPPDPESARIRCAYMLMLRTGPTGLIHEMKAYWGRSDLTVIV